jgi:hypothetical protein
MDTVLHVSPPVLMPWLNEDQVDNSLILLDFEPDEVSENGARLNLRVGFNAVSIYREGKLNEADYYIGCSSAEIVVRTITGMVGNYSPGVTLSTQYKGTSKATRTCTVTLQPGFKHKVDKNETELSLGSVSLAAGAESVFEYSFASEERVLAPLFAGRSIRWRLDSPLNPSIIRDFIFGNLYLFADCSWPKGPRRGQVAVRTHQVSVFGPNRRMLPWQKAILLRYKLRNCVKAVRARRGFAVDFVEVQR